MLFILKIIRFQYAFALAFSSTLIFPTTNASSSGLNFNKKKLTPMGTWLEKTRTGLLRARLDVRVF